MANPEGVWRTIGGRRIFIKTGQSVSSAMKESGKFKTGGKKKVDKNDLNALNKIADNNENINDYEGLDDIAKDYIKNRRNEIGQKEFTDKANEINAKTRERAMESEKTTDSNKRYNTQSSNTEAKRLEETQRQATKGKTNTEKESSNTEAMNYMQDQFKAFDKGDISSAELEKAKKDSGLSKEEIDNARKYVNDRAPESYSKATENKSGNTTSQAVPKGTSKSYKASDLEEGKPYEIDMGNGIKKTAIYMGKDSDGNSAFYDGEGVNGTFGFSDKFINEKLKISDNKDDDKFMELHNQIREKSKRATDEENKKYNKNNDWVRDAFNQYKKDHPNTKMTIADFKRNNLK